MAEINREEFINIRRTLLGTKKVKLQGWTKPEGMTLNDFYLQFYDIQDKYDTVYEDGQMLTPKGDYYRSLQEIYQVAHYYFNCKLLTFMKMVIANTVLGHYCNTIKRICLWGPNHGCGTSRTGNDKPCTTLNGHTVHELIDYVNKQ